MSYCDVYVGLLEDPRFSWDGGDWNGNAPTRIGPFFPRPAGSKGYEPWGDVIHRIKSGTWQGKQVDWGAWVAPLTGEEIGRYVDELYKSEPTPPDEIIDSWEQDPAGWLESQRAKDLANLRKFIAELESGKTYALVASEL